jgi:hypothetical protein
MISDIDLTNSDSSASENGDDIAQNLKVKRTYKTRVNFDWQNEISCKERFRMTPESLTLLENVLSPHLTQRLNSYTSISPRMQIMICLRWMGKLKK